MIIIAVETQDKTFGVFTRGTDHPVSLGTLRSDDGDGNENFKKAIELITKKTILHVHHAFLLISLPSLHDYENALFHDSQTEVPSDDEIFSLS